MMHWIEIWLPCMDLFKFCTMKEPKKLIEITLMAVLKKHLLRAIGSWWAQKLCHYNSIDFLRFCTIKGAKRYMKIISLVFVKKKFFRTNGSFWTQSWCVVITRISSNDLFKILHNEKGQEILENYLNGFSGKLISVAIGRFWLQICSIFFYFEQWKGTKGNIYILISVVITTYSVLSIL